MRVLLTGRQAHRNNMESINEAVSQYRLCWQGLPLLTRKNCVCTKVGLTVYSLLDDDSILPADAVDYLGALIEFVKGGINDLVTCNYTGMLINHQMFYFRNDQAAIKQLQTNYSGSYVYGPHFHVMSLLNDIDVAIHKTHQLYKSQENSFGRLDTVLEELSDMFIKIVEILVSMIMSPMVYSFSKVDGLTTTILMAVMENVVSIAYYATPILAERLVCDAFSCVEQHFLASLQQCDSLNWNGHAEIVNNTLLDIKFNFRPSIAILNREVVRDIFDWCCKNKLNRAIRCSAARIESST